MDINTDRCYYTATDPDMVLGGGLGWELTMGPGDEAGHCQQPTPLFPQAFNSFNLHNASAAPLLSLSHLSITYSNTVVSLWLVDPCMTYFVRAAWHGSNGSRACLLNMGNEVIQVSHCQTAEVGMLVEKNYLDRACLTSPGP